MFGLPKFIVVLALVCFVRSFQPLRLTRQTCKTSISMSGDMFQESVNGNTALSANALKPERYIATNRFKVRKNAGPKFEKRWADRKSRVADLEGFRFFTLLKKVEEDGSECASTDLGNYLSFTVWENKDNFNTWRSGDAFKEAHGGGGLTGFIGLLTTALFILDGGPKPAFYDGLLPVVNDISVLSNLKSENGWRKVEADGENFLNPEIFVVQTRFPVAEGKETQFEQRWATRESKLLEFPGFVGFYLQRRDATKADDGFNFVSSAIWKDKASFLNWRTTRAEDPKSHGGRGPVTGEIAGRPEIAFYEGKLTLLSPLGG